MYQVLEKRIDSTLLVAHRVINPILFGWKEGQNGLSNNAQEMAFAQSAYQNRYATPKQEQQEMQSWQSWVVKKKKRKKRRNKLVSLQQQQQQHQSLKGNVQRVHFFVLSKQFVHKI